YRALGGLHDVDQFDSEVGIDDLRAAKKDRSIRIHCRQALSDAPFKGTVSDQDPRENREPGSSGGADLLRTKSKWHPQDRRNRVGTDAPHLITGRSVNAKHITGRHVDG